MAKKKQKTFKNKAKSKTISALEQRKWGLLLGILILTFIAFLPSLQNGFTNWDDGVYVLENPVIQSFSFDNLKTMFSGKVVDNYFPFTMLSLAFNYAFSGTNAFGYHLFNLLLHLLNTFLVFWLAYRLSGGKTLVGAITAVLFGIHPMHVESVAWIAERKDVLYAAFFLGGLLSYLNYLSRKQIKPLIVCGLLFLFSLWSKPAAVVFPLVLLLIDYFKKRPFSMTLIVEKIPFFVLSVIFGLVTISIQADTAIGDIAAYSLGQKICFASYGMVMYLCKLLIPFKLSALYPYPIHSMAEGLPVIYAVMPLIALAVLGAVAYSVRYHRVVLFGFLFFLVNIILVLQFVAVGNAVMADRYTYLSYIGLFFVLAYFVQAVYDNTAPQLKNWKTPVLATVLGAILLFTILTFQRSKVWENSETLWTDVVDKYPENPLAYLKRGEHFYQQKNYPKALNDYTKSVESHDTYAPAYASRGLANFKLKKYQAAIKDYNKSIELNGSNAVAYNGRGHVYYQLKDYQKALPDYDKAISLDPNYYMAYNNRAIIFHLDKQYDKALENYNRALQINPRYGSALKNRGVLLKEMNR